MHAAAGRRRAGFTLVELLVAIGLAIVITAVTVAVLNTGVIESQRVISSADRVSQWLITAKNRAKRDGRPRGVRFFRSAADPSLLTEAEYVETPVPYNPNPTAAITGGRIVFVYGVDTTTGLVNARWAYYVNDTPANLVGEFDDQVHVGDLMYVPEFGTSYKLLAAPGTLPPNASSNAPYAFPKATVQTGTTITPNNARLLTLSSYPDLGSAHSPPIPGGATPPQACHATYGFSFQKTPRPLFGEPLLQLSPDAVIDARSRTGSPGSTSLNVSTSGDFEVLFAPSGQVLNQTVGLLAFLIRDPNKPEGNPLSLDPFTEFDNAGQMALVAVYTKTGAIATHPVVSAATPFQAAKDGVNAGF